jgi:hypothetical protein
MECGTSDLAQRKDTTKQGMFCKGDKATNSTGRRLFIDHFLQLLHAYRMAVALPGGGRLVSSRREMPASHCSLSRWSHDPVGCKGRLEEYQKLVEPGQGSQLSLGPRGCQTTRQSLAAPFLRQKSLESTQGDVVIPTASVSTWCRGALTDDKGESASLLHNLPTSCAEGMDVFAGKEGFFSWK